MLKSLDDTLIEKDIDELTNKLFKISQFCKQEQKKNKTMGSIEISNKFRNTKKLLLDAINELNYIKTHEKEYLIDSSKLKIGDIIDFSKSNETDYEEGVRVGFVFENIDTQEIIEIMTFDSDKNAIISLDPIADTRDRYINNGVWKRIE